MQKTPETVRDAVIGWRRHLHQHPELSFHEERTSQFIAERLTEFGGLEISRPTPTSVLARLMGARPGPVLAIRADIDGGVLSMVGLVRSATANPLDPNLGHQVIGYRYEEAASRVTLGVYDPNHPGDDGVTVGFDVGSGGELSLRQSTGEPLLGLLHLPWREARQPSTEA